MKKEYKDLSSEIEKLIEEGQRKGYISYKDARRIFSDNVVWSPYLEELFARLEEENLPFAVNGTIETLKEEVEEKRREPILKKDDLDPVSLYLKELKSVKLLSLEEERKIARDMEWDKLKIKAEEIKVGSSLRRLERQKELLLQKKHSPESLPEYLKNMSLEKIEKAIDKIKALEKNVKRAKNRLIEAHAFLVVGLAKHYAARGKLSFEELIEEGNIGLVRAADKYDYTQGYRFSSYALWWIKHAMLKAMIEKSSIVKLPTRKQQLLVNMIKAANTLQERLNKEPSLAEIASYLNVPTNNLLNLIYSVQPIISLEEEIETEEGKFTIGEFIEDKKISSPQQVAFIRELKEKVEEVLNQLSPQEKEVITSRFGLQDKPAMSFADIARKLNLSRERVRQITEKAISKLKRIKITKDLLCFVQES